MITCFNIVRNIQTIDQEVDSEVLTATMIPWKHTSGAGRFGTIHFIEFPPGSRRAGFSFTAFAACDRFSHIHPLASNSFVARVR
jgi:hypothetical protein